MENKLQIFSNEQFGSIRTMELDGKPYFVGKDVAEVLGYTDPQKAIKMHIDDEDKLTRQIVVSGQNRNMFIINESGLYSLILSSKLPKAKEFKRWVTSEVLPTIRKHGMYATDELLNNPDFAIKVFQTLKEERDKRIQLEKENLMQKNRLERLKPVMDYVKTILNSTGLMTVTQIAKDYGLSSRSFNNLLHSFQVQYKQNKQWLLYSPYQDKGYTQSRTTTKKDKYGNYKVYLDTLWTQKGRLFLYNFLKDRGIIPETERVKKTDKMKVVL